MQAKTDLIRVVLVGIGQRSEWALGSLKKSQDFEIAALVDKIGKRAEWVRSKYGLMKAGVYEGLEQCLEKCGEVVDAVVVLTPDGTHRRLAVESLEAGKFVFLEKPLEISEEGIAGILEADKRAGGRTFVGFNLRYSPVYRRLRRLVEEGELGKLLLIQADEFYDGGRTYFRRWNRLKKYSGGLWVTKGCHDFDLMYWMAGAEPVSVYAKSGLSYYRPKAEAGMYCRECGIRDECGDRYEIWTPGHYLTAELAKITEEVTGEKADVCLYNSQKDTFDHGMAQVSFANGVLGTYTVNMVTGITNRRMRLSGTRGTADADLESGRIMLYRRDPSVQQEILLESAGLPHGGGDEGIWREFKAFVNGEAGAQVILPGEAAVSVRMGLAAEESSCGGEVVWIR